MGERHDGRRSVVRTEAAADLGADRSLLIVDDDEPFRRRLARAMEKRGFDPVVAAEACRGLAATAQPPLACRSRSRRTARVSSDHECADSA
jgi:Response regulator consisting of a CheY-like receiver domain and a Fis-type HTH domain